MSRTEQYESAKQMLLGQLSVARALPEDTIRQTIEALRIIMNELTDADAQSLFDFIATARAVQMDLGVVVNSREHTPWLANRDFEWHMWTAYHQWLIRDGRPPVVLDALGRSLDVILDHLGNPNDESPWQRRSLVIGDVQSGKTSTYIGLINKAIDSGYRVIILLTGNTESLRQQTQLRVNEGVVGRDLIAARSSGTQFAHAPSSVGVGLIADTSFVMPLTTRDADFKKAVAKAMNLSVNSDNPLVFVTKKNKTVLDRIHKWLETQDNHDGKLTQPLLLIDDESDYASINTGKSDEDPTRINGAIRGLLRLFWRSSYVAFTATPFANIFIDDEADADLFPSDLIFGLDSPTNYIGPNAFFGQDSESGHENSLRIISDANECIPLKHKKFFEVESLPASLDKALQAFLLTNAIRDLRNQREQPRSMLVNVSRFIAVQEQVAHIISGDLTRYRNAIQWHGDGYGRGVANALLGQLEYLFAAEFSDIEFSWADVLAALPKATQDITCQIMNSKTDNRLEDNELVSEDVKRIIAIGGNILSRGLTLNGLTVSYFFRAPEADDTLMQMGRWFGYREGYSDICRVWMTDETASHFSHAAHSLDELRLELIRMRNQGLTPKQYGLAVRNHPGSHRLTARVKMRHASVMTRSLSLRGRTVESYELPSNPDQILSNRMAATGLLQNLSDRYGQALTAQNAPIWRGADRELIAQFFDSFSIAESASSLVFLDGVLAKFIREAKSEDLQTWDVAVIQGAGDVHELPGIQPPYRCVQRTMGRSHDAGWLVSDNKRRVAGTGDVAVGLDPRVKEEVRDDYFAENGSEKSVPDKAYVGRLDRPLLLLYFIQGRYSVARDSTAAESSKVTEDVPCNPMVATVIAIPGSAEQTLPADNVTYTMNTVAQRMHERGIDIDEGENDE